MYILLLFVKNVIYPLYSTKQTFLLFAISGRTGKNVQQNAIGCDILIIKQIVKLKSSSLYWVSINIFGLALNFCFYVDSP